MKWTSIRKLIFLLIFFIFFNVGYACEVTLGWTAPGDDGMEGSVAQYDIRFSETYLTSNNWDMANPITFNQEILPGGSKQEIFVEGLESGKTYYFALKSCDEASNWAPMSNVVPKIAGMENCIGKTGNVNCDVEEIVNIEDLTMLIGYIFEGGDYACCLGEANIHEPSIPKINIMDLTVFIQYYYFNFPLSDCN